MGYPIFAQRDPLWGNLELGTCAGVTIGASGCYLCSLCMGASSLGYTVTPPILQHLIMGHGLYVSGCEMTDDVLQKLGQLVPGSTPWHLLGVLGPAQAQTPAAWHSGAGEFAILGLNLGDHDHFVTVASWDGSSLLIGDPWLGAVVNFDQHYSRSSVFKLVRYGAPLPAPAPTPTVTTADPAAQLAKAKALAQQILEL